MTHHDLPLPDYDDLSSGALESRVRTLDAAGVEQVLAYERAHADRIQVVQILEHRLQALQTGDAQPSGGDPTASATQVQQGASGGSPVSPATQGPKQNPPSQGVPTNPAQPRT
ncbi:hypothetical protein [Nocardioides campestrisoli]|uniref:hypothetical protein n=1 Tax=Nocardioides campestrisoli TaxID=2736757 RepID=UPI0015E7C4B7|nr:hypothetical protein [Nocardioides campestrisoli]